MKEMEAPLLRYASRILKDQELAQDVVQDTFIKYLNTRREQPASIENRSAWLYRVTHNRALDVLRKRRKQVELSEGMEAVLEDATDPGPAGRAMTRDDSSEAWKLLDKLNERERTIVVLKVVENKSYQEIAETVDLTSTNVGFILHTAMKKLRKFARPMMEEGVSAK